MVRQLIHRLRLEQLNQMQQLLGSQIVRPNLHHNIENQYTYIPRAKVEIILEQLAYNIPPQKGQTILPVILNHRDNILETIQDFVFTTKLGVWQRSLVRTDNTGRHLRVAFVERFSLDRRGRLFLVDGISLKVPRMRRTASFFDGTSLGIQRMRRPTSLIDGTTLEFPRLRRITLLVYFSLELPRMRRPALLISLLSVGADFSSIVDNIMKDNIDGGNDVGREEDGALVFVSGGVDVIAGWKVVRRGFGGRVRGVVDLWRREKGRIEYRYVFFSIFLIIQHIEQNIKIIGKCRSLS